MLPVDHFDKGSSANTAELVGSPVLTVRNCSVSGYGVRNYLDPTQPGYVALSTIFKDKTEGVVLDFVSLGHNQWAGVQYAMVGDFVRGVDEIFEFLETSFPKSSRVYIAQNPKNHPGIEPANERHALGASRLLLRAKQGGFSSLNIFQAFKDSAIPLATLVNTTPGDYQHPTSEGSALWAEILMDAFNSNSL